MNAEQSLAKEKKAIGAIEIVKEKGDRFMHG